MYGYIVNQDRDEFRAITKFRVIDGPITIAVPSVPSSSMESSSLPKRDNIRAASVNIWNYNHWDKRYVYLDDGTINHWHLLLNTIESLYYKKNCVELMLVIMDQLAQKLRSDSLTPCNRCVDILGFQEVRARKASPHRTSRFQVDDLWSMLPGYQIVAQPAMAFNEGDHGKA
jgi:hypothetical protein